MDIENQKNVLLDAIQQQYQDNVAATEANRKLADEKISYQNEARGTYYSGIPTWERAQNAVGYGNKMGELNQNLLKTQNNVWSTISNYLDKINAYNEAAKNSSSQPSVTYTADQGYQFKDADGNPVTVNTWAKMTGNDVWDLIGKMAKQGDVNSIHAIAGYNNANKELTDEENWAFKVLGLDTSGYGRRD